MAGRARDHENSRAAIMSGVEYAGGPAGTVRQADEAMSSLAAYLERPVEYVIAARNAGQLGGLIEARQAQDGAPLNWDEAERRLRANFRVT
jgi:hypothetical protein